MKISRRRRRKQSQRLSLTRRCRLESLEDRIVLTGAAPIAVNDTFTVFQNDVIQTSAPGVLANDSDPEGDVLSAELFTGVRYGQLSLNADGSFVYTPDQDFVGFDSFTYQANDGTSKSFLAAVTLDVKQSQVLPSAVNDQFTATEDSTLSVAAENGVISNDSGGNGSPLAAMLVTPPEYGTITLESDGSFNYVPASDFYGTDGFSYLVTDGETNSDVATATIEVAAVNDAPTADGSSFVVDEDDTLTVAANGVLQSAADIDGDSLEAILNSSPQNGTLTLNADGSFVYTPNADFNGDDSFSFRATDGSLSSEPVTVSITVNPTNDAPSGSNEQYTVDEDLILTEAAPGVLQNDSDANGDAITAILISQPINGTVALNADGSFTYTPDANYNGLDGFSYQVSDGTLTSDVLTATIDVNPVNDTPQAINEEYATDEDTTLTVNAAGVLENDSDVDGDSITAVLVTQPKNGTVTLNTDGSFTYTPDADFYGTDGFSYQASDGNLSSDVATATIVVNPVNDAPSGTNDEYATAEDTELIIALPGVLSNDADIDGDAIEALLVSGPANGTLALNTDGSFSYTPEANFNGTDGFSYQVSDGIASSSVIAVSIEVAPVNDAPTASNDQYSVDEDSPLNVAAAGVLANDADVDGDPLTTTLISNPANGTLTLNPDGSFDYQADANFNGSVEFSYQVTDGSLSSDVATVTIEVNPINDPPTIVNDEYMIDEDVVLNVDAPGVLSNDSDIDGDLLTATLLSDPANGSVQFDSDGSFSYTPNANFYGSDEFTYQVSDGTTNSDVVTATIVVNPVNDNPVAANEQYETDEDAPLTIDALGVLANDSDIDGDSITASLVSDPSYGTLAFQADGSFVYTPNANYNGTDGFSYQVSDGSADSDVVTATITVRPINDPPVASPDEYSLSEDSVLTVDAPGVLDNDSDIDGDALTATLLSGVGHGDLTFNDDGSFTYTPQANYSGTDEFTYQVSDGSEQSDPVTVTLIVASENDAPLANDDLYSVGEDQTLSTAGADGVLRNDIDLEDDSLTASLVSQPGNGSLSFQPDGSFEYIPTADFFGSDSFSYEVSDGTESATATVTITVEPLNDAPVAVDDDYLVGSTALLVDPAQGVLQNDTDVENDGLTARLLKGPELGTLSFNSDGSFTYTPGPAFVSSDMFMYQVSDGTTDGGIAVVNLKGPASFTAPAADDSYETVEDTILTIAADTGVLANDINVPGLDLSAVVDTPPQYGSLQLNTDGSFSYTPDADFNGTDFFTYTAIDNTDPATVTVLVAATNDTPVANDDDSYATQEDTVLLVPAYDGVLANDTDVDGDSLQATLVSGPQNGMINLTPDGSFIYIPELDFYGTDSFVYTASDDDGATSEATVTIQVGPVNDAPLAVNDSFTVSQLETLDVAADQGLLSNDSDPEGDSLTALLVTSVSNGQVTLNQDGAFQYTPTAGFYGTDGFTYQVTDGTDVSDVASVTINVLPENVAPVAANETFRIEAGTSLTVNAPGVLSNDSDANGDSLTATLFNSVTEGSLDFQSDGSFSYTPDVGFVGIDSFTYQATDGANASNLAAVTIYVDAAGEGALLQAATQQVLTGVGDHSGSVTLADISLLVQDALANWQVTFAQQSQSSAALDQVQFGIRDLFGDVLGLAVDNTVYIDIDAAGNGWFIGRDADDLPVDQIDLLSVLMHELGHVAGFQENSIPGDVMNGILATGQRHSLELSAVDQAFSDSGLLDDYFKL